MSTAESVSNDKVISLPSEDNITDDLNKSQSNSRSIAISLVNSNNMDTHIEQLPECLKIKSDPERILSHTVLNLISNYKRLFCNSHSIGQPTTIKVSLLIAVGYTEGFIILFDSSQRYLWYHKSVDCGAVSAVDFNHNCSRLLVGYINGTIIMFDSSSATCKILHIIKDVLTPNTAVLNLKFTDFSNLLIVNDSAGSVFELNIKKCFYKWSVMSKKFFSGHPCKVYCIEPLLFNQLTSHPMNGYVIIAMATLSKIIIFVLRPNTELLLSHDIISSKLCLPLLSWQFIATHFKETSNSNHQIMNPVLVFIQDDTIYFYLVKLNEEKHLCCCNVRKVTLPYTILAFSWMNHRTFLIISALKKVHLIDIFLKDEIEHLDLSNISLVYTSNFYDDSGNQHLDKCCYSSIYGHNGQLIFLGDNNINIIRVRSWTEYLDNLTEKKLFTHALHFGVKFLQKKSKPIYNMRISQAPGQKVVEKKIIDIVALYIDSMSEENNPIYYEDGIAIVMYICVYLKKTNVLFNHLWDCVELFESSCNVFLDCLVKYVVNNQINDVPTIIIQKLFIYLSLTNQFKKLERCILNVKIEFLDLDQSVKLVRTHSLYYGFISIWTRALQDYITPLQELVPKIKTINGDYNHFTITLGNKILNYLTACLIGITYPNKGSIPVYLQHKVRSDTIQFLCSLHSIKARDDEYIYPYLRILLKFNTTKYLNMLRITDCYISCLQKQRIICILSSLITANNELNAHQLGSIYVFIVEWQKNDNNPIILDKRVFETVIALLTSSLQKKPHEETEKILSRLICLGEFNNNPNLLKIVEQAKLLRINTNVGLYTNYLKPSCQYAPSVERNFAGRNNSICLPKSIVATRIVLQDHVCYELSDRFSNFKEAFEFVLTQLQKYVQQENASEECMQVLVSTIQRESSIINSKITWLSILQYFISLHSHDHLKEVLNSSDLKLLSEIQSLLNCHRGTIGSFKNYIMGIIDNYQYVFQLFKSPEMIQSVDLQHLSIKEMNGDKHCAVNPVLCSLCKQKYINIPMITFRCGHRFHSNCLGVNTVCTFCTSTNNNV